ncbi:MAG: deoxyribose-phosphate aldolase [Alphaproteobacteria bacterium]|nr:MAG: deoxyribose-phosphate aldolase [Alphaproteobacteria bacterium]
MKNFPERLAEIVEKARAAKPDATTASVSLHSLDLTSLNDDDTPEKIEALTKKADQGKLGHVAATCVYPKFLRQVFNATAKKDINRATVINFPSGKGDPAETYMAAKTAIYNGANEIDIVLDYDSFMKGDTAAAAALLRAARKACGEDAKLKVILESAAFDDYHDLYAAGRLALDCGADFLKTSTGKSAKGGASLEAVATLLEAIVESGKPAGLKVSGGVKTVGDCAQYIALARGMMGEDFISTNTFRIGASGVLTDILQVLGAIPATAPAAKPSVPATY